MGVFARRFIPAGTVLGMYGGRYMTGEEADDEHDNELLPNLNRTDGPSINDCLLDMNVGGRELVIDGSPRALSADGATRDSAEGQRRRYWGGLINAAPRGTGEDGANTVFVRGTRGAGFKAGPLRNLQLPIIFCIASKDIQPGDEASGYHHFSTVSCSLPNETHPRFALSPRRLATSSDYCRWTHNPATTRRCSPCMGSAIGSCTPRTLSSQRRLCRRESDCFFGAETDAADDSLAFTFLHWSANAARPDASVSGKEHRAIRRVVSNSSTVFSPRSAPQEERRAATALATLTPANVVGRLVSCLCDPDDDAGPSSSPPHCCSSLPKWRQGTVVGAVPKKKPPRWLVKFCDGSERELGVRSRRPSTKAAGLGPRCAVHHIVSALPPADRFLSFCNPEKTHAVGRRASGGTVVR